MNLKKLKSSELDAAIIGMILGDGCLRRKPDEHNYQYIMTHPLKQQDYANWKRKILEQIGTVKTYEYIYKGKYSYITISTNTRKYFTKLANKFYSKDRKKIVNRKILNKLTPLGIALWYMDDGTLSFSKKGNFSNCEIYTCSFSLEENKLIQKWFKETYNIDVKIRIRKNKYYSIAFNSKNYKDFINIVKPYIIPSMNYKIYKEIPPKEVGKIKEI